MALGEVLERSDTSQPLIFRICPCLTCRKGQGNVVLLCAQEKKDIMVLRATGSLSSSLISLWGISVCRDSALNGTAGSVAPRGRAVRHGDGPYLV